jgi:hypothetical protein
MKDFKDRRIYLPLSQKSMTETTGRKNKKE